MNKYCFSCLGPALVLLVTVTGVAKAEAQTDALPTDAPELIEIVQWIQSDWSGGTGSEPTLFREIELDEIAATLAAYALRSAQQALELASLATSGYERYRLTSPLLRSWTLRDPVAAFGWAQQQAAQGEALYDEALPWMTREISVHWAQNDAQSFIRFLATQPAELRQALESETAALVATTLAELNPPNALDWADSLSGSARSEARLAAFSAWYRTAPDAALDSRQLLDAQEQAQFLADIAWQLPEHDMQLAHSLFEHAGFGHAAFGESADAIRLNLAWGILAELFRQNADQARQWVATLPRDEVYTESALNLVYLLAQEQPEQAWLYLRRFAADQPTEIVERGLWSIAAVSEQTVRALHERIDLSERERHLLRQVISGLDNPELFEGC